MESLGTDTLHVVLGIKQGVGFGFLTQPIVVAGTLYGNQIETDIKQPGNEPHFHTDLVWQADKKNLRRLRTANTAIKIECFSIGKSEKKQKLGYVHLNLKQAQVIPRASSVQVIETWHKLLGVPSELKQKAPEILISLKIEEAETPGVFLSPKKTVEAVRPPKIRSKVLPEGWIQVGAQEECTEDFELIIEIFSSFNLSSIVDSGDEENILFQFILFDCTFHVKNVPRSKVVVRLQSALNTLLDFFGSSSPLVLTVILEGRQIGTTSIDMKRVFSSVGLDISESKKSSSMDMKLIIASKDLPSDCKKPYINTAISFNSKKDQLNEEPVFDDVALTLDPLPSLSPLRTSPIRSPALKARRVARIRLGSSSSSEEEKLPVMDHGGGGDCAGASGKHNETQTENIGFPLRYVERCPCQCDGNKKCEEFLQEEATRICEELEDWKERQQTLFKKELKEKFRKRNVRLHQQWLDRQAEIEEDYRRRIAHCQRFSASLENFSKELSDKSEALLTREKEVLEAETELSRQYSAKFFELQEASKRFKAEMEHKLNVLRAEKEELKTKLAISNREKEALQKALDLAPSKTNVDQTGALIIEAKCLEEKLKAALESKAFFKEQWARAVREIHTLKTEQQEQLRRQILRNQQELGLVETLSRGDKELKEDQVLIQSLKHQLNQMVNTSKTS